MRLSVFFPAYNEEANIKRTVEKAEAVVKPLVENYEVIIVNDGSSDRTGKIAEELASKNPHIRVIHHPKNRGYGGALKTGFYNSKYEWIVFTDADGQFNFQEITSFLDKINDYDLIIGYRRKRVDPLIRKINARLFNLEMRLLFGLKVKDVDCGFKLVKRQVLDKIEKLESECAMIEAELLIKAKKAGFKIDQVPVSHYPRKKGKQTGANLKVIFRGAIIEPLRLWRRLALKPKRYFPYLMVFLAFVGYFFHSALRHYTFRSYSWDLGIYHQAVWKYSRLTFPSNTVLDVSNILGDHFELILMFFAPLYWLKPSAHWLLGVQALAVSLGGLPIFWLGVEKIKNYFSAILVMLTYYFFIGIQTAIDFDFHPIVLATCFLPFALYFAEKKRWFLMLLMLLLALLTKESVALYLIFFGIYLIVWKHQNFWGSLVIFFAGGWFLTTTQYIMPVLLARDYAHFNYQELGSTPISAVLSFFSRPLHSLRIFFSPRQKIVSLTLLFGSFAFLPFFSPKIMFLSIPMVCERFLSTTPNLWQMNYHYSASIAPFLAIASAESISKINIFFNQRYNEKYKKFLLRFKVLGLKTSLGILLFLSCLGIGFLSEDGRYVPLVNFYKNRKWREIDWQNVRNNYQAMKLIPDKTSVTTQDAFVSHLAARHQINRYEGNEIKASFVLLNPTNSYWPLRKDEVSLGVESLLRSEGYGLIYSVGTTLLFQNGVPDKVEPSEEIREYLNI